MGFLAILGQPRHCDPSFAVRDFVAARFGFILLFSAVFSGLFGGQRYFDAALQDIVLGDSD